MPPRSWMKTINRFSDAMRCVPWDRTHPLPPAAETTGPSKRVRMRGSGGMHHNANRSNAAFVTVANRRCTVK